MKSTVGFIPARGGSKGIPNKNVMPLAGKPLIQWIVEASLNATRLDEVVVSTDSELVRQALSSIVSTKLRIISRGEETATDTATTESAMLEFAEQNEFENIMLLQATSPLTSSDDIDKAMECFDESKSSVISVVESKRFTWDWQDDQFQSKNYDYNVRPRRQEISPYYIENGALYITSREKLLMDKNRLSKPIFPYVMAEDTLYELDEVQDIRILESLLKKRALDHVAEPMKVKLFISDVDGVLTDGSMYYSNNGDELKRFSTYDGVAFARLKEMGIKTALITSEETHIVANRASKMGIDELVQGAKYKGKYEAASALATKYGIGMEEVLYVGDDINCVDLLKSVGNKFCPSNAKKEVTAIPGIVKLNTRGGDGVIREILEEYIMRNAFL